MIRMACCDDDPAVLNEIQILTEQYCAARGQEVSARTFNSPFDLIAEIEKGVQYDILILDILMPGETGISMAAEIRNFDRSVKIIFLTSSSEYAIQSYTVGAYYYQLKPIQADDYFRLMDAVISVCEKEREDSLIVRCRNGITRIELRRIEYCEVFHRTLFFHLTNGMVLESIGSLGELSRHLQPYKNFLRFHRSYIVNLEYVQNLSYRSVIMASMADIPIPRGKYEEIKQAFLEYTFQTKQVTI